MPPPLPRTPATASRKKRSRSASTPAAAAQLEEQQRFDAAGELYPFIERLAFSASAEVGSLGPRLAVRASEPTGSGRLPPVSEIRRFNTTRLLPSKYSESVLTRIAENEDDLALIFALDSATNDRLLAEGNLRLGISARELVFNVPHYRIINAAFCHPHPQGGRFSLPYRGAWYAGFDLPTAKAEVLFHRALQFYEISWDKLEELDYDQYSADFCGAFHDLRPHAEIELPAGSALPAAERSLGASDIVASEEAQHKSAGAVSLDVEAALSGAGALAGAGVIAEAEAGIAPRLEAAVSSAQEFAACLDPRSYVASQRLTLELLEAGSPGILYPSARRGGGNCIACFRPSLVCNVRKRDLYRLTWYPDRAATFLRCARPAAAAV